ncbi:MAG: hypothetical protein AAF743_10995 [Planctomycetota bacterium]
MSDACLPSRGRRRFVLAGLGIVVLLHVGGVVVDKELWPLSRYAMYSSTHQADTWQTVKLVGLAGGQTVDLPGEQLPLPHTAIIARLTDAPDDVRQELCSDLLAWHDRRRADDPTLPELDGVRLERFTWNLDTTLANVTTPDDREVLLELRRDALGD